MRVNQDTGIIRNLSEGEPLKENESPFIVGETIEVKDCFFEVMEIKPEEGTILLHGIPKPVETEPPLQAGEEASNGPRSPGEIKVNETQQDGPAKEEGAGSEKES